LVDNISVSKQKTSSQYTYDMHIETKYYLRGSTLIVLNTTIPVLRLLCLVYVRVQALSIISFYNCTGHSTDYLLE